MAETPPHDAYAPTVTPDPPARGPATADSETPSPGAMTTGRYRASSLIGRGGMGEIRLCHDDRIGRDVALKVMHAYDADARATAIRRFSREARIQGQLEHPAIVPVYDLGTDDEGMPFFTMRRVAGLTLAAILDGLRTKNEALVARFSRRKLLAAFISACEAVEYAHSRCVVHRDLKPSNLMLGDFGEVYVLDWGIAKTLQSADDTGRPTPPSLPSAAAGDATGIGQVLGTPGYIAPEQVRRADAVGPAADIYALGAILFEILTLEPLHARGSVDDLMAATVLGSDARASVRAPHRDVPPELEAICVRATALDPAARFASTRQLIEAVERYLDGDRDLERRKQLAEEHASRAAANARRAFEDSPDALDARSSALNEAGRALALDARQPQALSTLLRLLVEPPRRIPAEVDKAMGESSTDQWRRGAVTGGFVYLACIPFAGLIAWMGVRDMGLFALTAALLVTLAATSLVFGLSRWGRPPLAIVVATLNAIGLVVLSRIFGPFVIVPAFAVASTMVFASHVDGPKQVAVIALGCVGVAVPAVGEWLGVFSPSYLFEAGRLVILPQLAELPSLATNTTLLFSSLAMVIGASFLIALNRRARIDAERRLMLQTWALRQLVPSEARASSTS
jgi:serine/threonine protein kinase